MHCCKYTHLHGCAQACVCVCKCILSIGCWDVGLLAFGSGEHNTNINLIGECNA